MRGSTLYVSVAEATVKALERFIRYLMLQDKVRANISPYMGRSLSLQICMDSFGYSQSSSKEARVLGAYTLNGSMLED